MGEGSVQEEGEERGCRTVFVIDLDWQLIFVEISNGCLSYCKKSVNLSII